MSENKPIFETEVFPAYKDYLQPARFKCAYGGRGSGKTRTFCSILLNNCLFFGWRIVCFREIMETIKDSVYQEFVAEIERRNLGPFFEITASEIKAKQGVGVIRFSGIKSSAKRLDSQKLKGFSDFDAAWLEEANAVSQESWDALIPTMRKSGSEIWVSFNPDSILEPTYKMFVSERYFPDFQEEHRYAVIKEINWQDNPRFPKELRDAMEQLKENDYEAYLHIYEGKPLVNNEMAVIKIQWIQAAIDAHEKLGVTIAGERKIAFDVADRGEDMNAIARVHGIYLDSAEQWSGKESDIYQNTARALQAASEYGASSMLYDGDGIGAGVRGDAAMIQSQNQALQNIDIQAFVGSSAVVGGGRRSAQIVEGRDNEDMFLNYKAQSWWALRCRFERTYQAITAGKAFDPDEIISINGNMQNIDTVIAELTQPQYRFNGAGKMIVDKKPEGAKSPNLADAIMMCYAPVVKRFL